MKIFENKYRAYENRYKEYVIGRIIDMDDPDIPQKMKDDIEITVDLTNEEFHKVNIDLKRNNTRVEEVKKIRENVLNRDKETGKQRIDKDVLIIYIDNIARVHFHRKLKNLTHWLEENSNTEGSEYNSYEYFRYHSKAFYTHPNGAAMFCGVDNVQYNDSTLVFRSFSENGYITGYYSDICKEETMDFDDVNTTVTPYYSYDHFAGNIAWDFHYDTVDENYIQMDKGRNSYFRRWLYGKPMHDIQLEYVKQFWDKYNDTRKVFRTVFNENHEPTGELIKYNDNGYVNLLSYFNEKGYLKNTIVMIVSDHGTHFVVSRTSFLPDDSRLGENYLSLLIMLIPRDIPLENMKFLENNQQLFVTAHEIYGTLKSLAMGELSRSNAFKGYSFMHEDLPKGRDCDQNKGEIWFRHCYCSLDKDYVNKILSKRSYFYVEL